MRRPAVVSRILDRVMKWIERTLAYGFIAAVSLNFINVVGRYGFGVTILSADEIQIFIMVFMAFLGAAVVAWNDRHLRMDVIVNALPMPVRQAVRMLELIVVAILAGFVLWNSSYYVKQMFVFGRVSDMAGVPMWIPHGAVALGFGLIALIMCLRIIELVTGRPADSREPGQGR
jgi:TRAP-type C4-dicarboxylate transport system permease small subunit